MAEYKVHQLWPKPIFDTEIPVKPEWLDYAYSCEYERVFIDNADYTKDKYILDKLPDLKKLILEQVNIFTTNYLKVLDIEFYFLNSWILKHTSKDWAQDHMHENSLLSGVYYLDTPKDAGGIVFVKGYGEQEIFPSAITPKVSEYNYVTSKEMTFKVNSGKLVLFPSNLMHRVEVNKSNKSRYSLAFNLFCRGDFGQKEGRLTL
jgi:uncharacterized protein (TIGR02466 family)